MRYPGRKGKLINEIGGFIAAYYADQGLVPYREPFFGSGVLGLHVLSCQAVPGAWFNDADPGIAAIWEAVLTQPESLCRAVRAFTPSVQAFFDVKEGLLAGTIQDRVQLALSKLAVHQLSFSGLGTLGGPLGGRNQSFVGAIASRWNPESLCTDLMRSHSLMARSRAVVTNLDFEDVIDGAGAAFVYLDPPYFEKGAGLYQHSFQECDHLRLAACLQRTANPWLLSYDDTPEIREMYAFAQVLELTDIKYTIKTVRTKGELLVLSPNLPNLFDRVAVKRKYGGARRDIFAE